jgi:hypothetical protein
MMLKCILLKDSADNARQLGGFIAKSGLLHLEAITTAVKETSQLVDTHSPEIIFLPQKQYQHLRNELTGKTRIPALICLLPSGEQPLQNGGIALAAGPGPIQYTAFLEAVSRALVQLVGRRPAALPERTDKCIFVKSEYRIIKINLEDIIFCEGLKDYTQIYTGKKNKPIITLQNLKTFSERLPPQEFVRIHRSYIISVSHIESITKKEVEIAEKILPIGNSYRAHLLEIIRAN